VPLTVGTAGHVDHGKTWLVRALTGKDTDRLPEERERGISIDLGYAPLDLPDGRRLSLIDVPGHERFVRTMVAGATGIDLFLLVVDATEGVRPQTLEHLAVLALLGVDAGVIAVTKADAVDEETLELALAEAHELVPSAPVVPVSAKTGVGLDDLRGALGEVAARVEHAGSDGPTRLFVDRVFTLRGIGTVATGTLWSGTISPGDTLRAEPAGLSLRVRSVQVHDRAVDVAEAGQRVAVNVPGVDRNLLRRGDALVAPGAYTPSYRVDVELEELAEIPDSVLVHHGTSATLARVFRSGPYAQLRLASPLVAARNDRVVLRGQTTLGGGRVIEAAPPRHTSRERFEREARGERVVYAPVRDEHGQWTYADEWLDELKEELGRRLEVADPLDPAVPAPAEPWLAAVLPRLGLELRGSRLYRPGAAASLAGREQEAAELEARLGLDPVKLPDRTLARVLEEQGRLVRVGDGYAVSPRAYDEARGALVAELEDGGAITLAGFRDLVGTSRRTAQMLLERFDADGITRRVGDERVLRRSAARS
jgi:selenocysteine-specific elongation factor